MKEVYILKKNDRDNFIIDFNNYLDSHQDGYLLVLSPLDTFRKELQGEALEKEMAQKLAEILELNPTAILATPKKLFQFPNRITGVMLDVEKVHKLPYRLNDRLQYNYEADFLLKLIQDNPFMVSQDIEYFQGEPGDGNFREFEGIYDKAWYMNNLEDFLIPMLKEYQINNQEKNIDSTSGSGIPYMVQYYAMYNITCRLNANHNNNNRHVLSGDEIELFKDKIREALSYIDDSIIMNVDRYPVYKRDFQFSRMLLRIKYGRENMNDASGLDEGLYEITDNLQILDETVEDIYHTQIIDDQHLYFTLKDSKPINSTFSLKCNIQFMDYRNGKLEIDGSFPDTYDKTKIENYFKINGKKYPVSFCERYSLTKYFGVPAYKRYPFHVSVPIDEVFMRHASASEFQENAEGNILECYLGYKGKEYQVGFQFESHTSRLAAYPFNSYWHFGNYLASIKGRKNSNGKCSVYGIKISSYNWFKMAVKEIGYGSELLFSFQMHRFHFFLLRAAWVATRPYFKNKNIWMFFDKIYKAGDSSEYLYKYASKQIEAGKGTSDKYDAPDKLYYLVDVHTSDYKRLVKEGYKPLKRGSFLHRLIFLNADMMIVSNSTVFAFNDYYMENSRYIRGIPDFHVVCVQHGLSVQKIALAQQRLRDNTRLYFCASKYEIDNLSHPVYDYVGYDALKLTGVPRYDGLVDNDKKQIMISPTWRMQSAMLVSKNEGVERDYNPFFKDTDYYKVYNGLINDERLINAAKEYGYRIAYVLHPIVSPQAKDFDSNEYVDIIPSVGDMSYEKMFCESSLMVTDYSGIQFDFAYMRKPLVYYHPEELEAHYEEGSFHYDTMAFGEIVKKRNELVDLLIDYMKNGCKMKDEFRRRADDFYEYNDRNNCQRIYDEIVRYQRNLK